MDSKCICIKKFENIGHGNFNPGEIYSYRRDGDANVVSIENSFGCYFEINSDSRKYKGSFSEHFITMEEYRNEKISKLLT